MTSEAPSWADQWGTGGIGEMPEEDNTKSAGVSLSYSEKKILNSTQTFIDQAILHPCIGLSEEKTDEFLMNRMNWPL
ncbi:hypothetical protein F2Q69_00041082 [Brassica cretica]|uniref:Uncharacterized protein n=1 Tax=Brassica cretica TaxID=69181 RepID=A0A8S9NGK1_BRACR|nr:hypothetical protein F2Q69_00041082 [Brassica cretica]